MVDLPNSYTKKDLRAYFKSLRSRFTQREIQLMDQQMVRQFARIPLKNRNLTYILSYQPMRSLNEVDPKLFHQYWLKAGVTDIAITFPRTDFQTLEMEAVLPHKSTVFIQNSLNLAEPDKGSIIEAGKIDLVLLPLLTFDTRGNRVGYGKGFYDRYLARCRPDVLKIGLSYLPAVPQIADVNPFDIPLDYCVTPDQLYEFK